MADEIIRELWQIKDHIASKHNYDVKNLVAYLQKKRRDGKHEVVDLRSTKKAGVSLAPTDLKGSATLQSENR